MNVGHSPQHHEHWWSLEAVDGFGKDFKASHIMRQATTHDAEKFHEHRRGHRLLGELAEEKADGLEVAVAVGARKIQR